VAIQSEVSSSSGQQHNGNYECRGRRAARKSRRSRPCSTCNPRPPQSRGPSYDWGISNELVVKLMPLVKRVALQLRGHLPARVELADLVSDGTVGLIDAVRKFDPVRGVTIESYARYRIRGAILDSLRDQDHASRDLRRRIKKVESTCSELERRLGRPAEDVEVARAMGLSLSRWYQTSAELQRHGYEGTGSRVMPDTSKRINEDDLPASCEDNPFALCYRREQRDLLSRALRCLTGRERSIIAFYYKDALTMKEIGSRLGIDESRVSQLHSGALLRLRSRVAAMLRPVADGIGFRRPAPGPDGPRGERFAAVNA
jgi:RNA polymerase sigma factor for flagellar operon FliA